MFGLLRPTGACGGPCTKRETYARAYCGLCAGIGAGHGLIPRATLSYDGVFVVLLADALVEEPAPPGRCRCPALPLVHRSTMAASSTAVRFATAVHMLLVDQFVADKAMEGKLGMGLARGLTRAHADRAWAELADLGVDVTEVQGFESKQAEAESSDDPVPTRAAEPTAWALSMLFAGIAQLPGVEAAAEDLSELGASVGRSIYLVDALEDLDQDTRNGEFNPCLRDGAVDGERLRMAHADLRRSLVALREAFERIPWRRHRSVLADILIGSFSSRAWRSMESTRHAVPTGAQRVVRLFLAFGALLWAWLCAVPRVFAQTTPHHHGRDAAAADASSKPIEMPKIDITPGPTTTTTTTPTTTPTPGSGFSFGAPTPTTGPSPAPASGHPTGCPCTDCCKSGKDCCDVTDQCCKCCDGCGKGDCGGCGCGDCCK